MNQSQQLTQAIDALADGMAGYIAIYKEDNGEEPYGAIDVSVCKATLTDYLQAVMDCGQSDARIIKQVEATVKELNILNEKCDYSLIETGEREEICDIIINGARLAGYSFPGGHEDVTEQWRDW